MHSGPAWRNSLHFRLGRVAALSIVALSTACSDDQGHSTGSGTATGSLDPMAATGSGSAGTSTGLTGALTGGPTTGSLTTTGIPQTGSTAGASVSGSNSSSGPSSDSGSDTSGTTGNDDTTTGAGTTDADSAQTDGGSTESDDDTESDEGHDASDSSTTSETDTQSDGGDELETSDPSESDTAGESDDDTTTGDDESTDTSTTESDETESGTLDESEAETEPDTGDDTGDPVCGNDIHELGEECDDGNMVTEACEYGERACLVCDAECNKTLGQTSWCGDGHWDTNHEECDDGMATETCTADCKICRAKDPVVDQALLDCDDGIVDQCVGSLVVENGQSAAQGFQVGLTGVLSEIKIRYANGESEAQTVDLLVVPGTTANSLEAHCIDDLDAIAVEAIPLSLPVTGSIVDYEWYTVDLSGNTFVEAGEHYFIVLRYANLSDQYELEVAWGGYNHYDHPKADFYKRGLAFDSGHGDDCRFTARDSYVDLEFQTVVTESGCAGDDD